jgi:amino-acid N-acetyltransferase
MRLADLREILKYVPQYRDRTFVIAVDSAVVEDEHFRTLLMDIALLRSLRIRVALVHGAAYQIRKLAEQTGQHFSNDDGTAITDRATLELALTASTRISHEILEGLAAHDLRAAYGNAVVAHPAGILQGVDQLFTGKVERVDTVLLEALVERDIIPVIPPIGCDGEGHSYRINSDNVAVEVARALHAVKLIYLTTFAGIRSGDELIRQISMEEADTLLRKQRSELTVPMASKLSSAVQATRDGIPRVHIIDGRVEEGLLAEVFSNEGIGTLIHANEYQAIRQAQKKDVRSIYALIQPGMESDELMRRTKTDIEKQINDFIVLEIDRTPVACASLHIYPTEQKMELACLCVASHHGNQGLGLRLIQYAENKARVAGVRELFCLSTQAYNYFLQKGGFRAGSPEDLPPERRDVYHRNGRNSLVLIKSL